MDLNSPYRRRQVEPMRAGLPASDEARAALLGLADAPGARIRGRRDERFERSGAPRSADR